MKLKKLFLIGFSLLFVTTLFGQTYEEYLAKAKQYEAEKRWAFALGAYYDAMGTDLLPEEKKEAHDGYVTLRNAILSGNPGLGKFNAFTLHDEWKNLLIDAEKFGSSFNPYILTIGDLVQGDLNYENRTASYSAKISYTRSEKYDCTIGVVRSGLYAAHKEDWSDIPSDWPYKSVSYEQNEKYNVNGALIFSEDAYHWAGYILNYTGNAFAFTTISDYKLFDYKFTIVDENGKELVEGKRWLLEEYGGEITFTDIPVSVMEIIDSGKAFVNPVACYLQYGKCNVEDKKGGRTFIKNLPEVELPINKNDYICSNNKENERDFAVSKCMLYYLDLGLIEIPGLNIEMGKTELFFKLKMLVDNPFRYDYLDDDYYYDGNSILAPCTVSFFEAVELCNNFSIAYGLDCVYSVDGETNPANWKYDDTNSLQGEIVIDTSSNGFRLPTLEEWTYAAKGGENFIYSGSNDINEVAWYCGNSDNNVKNVAQKKANAYGLYDMSGNVSEWTSSQNGNVRIICGGSYRDSEVSCKIDCRSYGDPGLYYAGFRLVRTITEENTDN